LREYETVFILRPTVEDSRVEEEIEGVRQVIQAASGEILGIERWGRRRLAYEIRRMNEGIYTLVRFRANASIVQDLERRYRLREDVLRHLTVISQGPPPEAVQHREGEEQTPEHSVAGAGNVDASAIAGTGIQDATTSPGQSPTEEIQASPEAGSQLP
jgi:small subunit ribosomal protein S6